MKILTISSTRPDFIRLMPTVKKLDKFFGDNHKLIWIAQNFANSLSTQFFKEFNRQPDICLKNPKKEVGLNYLGYVYPKLDTILKSENPDCVLVLGDTNGSLATVTAAKKLGITVFHLEAGNRCFDSERVPEEVNRYMIDSISDFHLCYTQRAREHLLLEGKRPDRCIVVGNPICECIFNLPNYPTENETTNDYYLVTLHRKENIEDKSQLNKIFQTLSKLDKHVKVSAHPSLMSKFTNELLQQGLKNIEFFTPSNFSDFIDLEMNAYCIITDSGTVPEEATLLHKPCVLLRYSTERPELLENNSMVLCDNVDNLLTSIKIVTCKDISSTNHTILDYHISTSDNVLKLIQRNRK